MYNIHLLPAAYGDSILIEYGEHQPHYILIDGGPYYNFEEWIKGLHRVAPSMKELELLVITHIDIDHIDGIVTLLKKKTLPFTIKEIWFNGYDQIEDFKELLGVLQGEYISSLINQKSLPHNVSFNGNAVAVSDANNLPVIPLSGGMEITLLSPSITALDKLKNLWKKELKNIGTNAQLKQKLEEDSRYDSEDDLMGDLSIEQLQNLIIDPDVSTPNGSSIAFIGKYAGKTCLFAADAPSDRLLESIEPLLAIADQDKLQVDAWKLAHHGSKKSTVDRLMKKIDCKNILVSSNGAKFGHPDEACIAKLIKYNGPGLQFYFNYLTKYNEYWSENDLQRKYNFQTFYPVNPQQPGVTISI